MTKRRGERERKEEGYEDAISAQGVELNRTEYDEQCRGYK